MSLFYGIFKVVKLRLFYLHKFITFTGTIHIDAWLITTERFSLENKISDISISPRKELLKTLYHRELQKESCSCNLNGL